MPGQAPRERRDEDIWLPIVDTQTWLGGSTGHIVCGLFLSCLVYRQNNKAASSPHASYPLGLSVVVRSGLLGFSPSRVTLIHVQLSLDNPLWPDTPNEPMVLSCYPRNSFAIKQILSTVA